MRAMILAAGRGERMRPLTDALPKPLLAAGGKPLIVHHIENLVRAGFTHIVINTAWLGHKLVAALGDGARWGAQIQYSHESEALETAGGIAHALPLLGEEPFLLVNGDVYVEWEFSQARAIGERLTLENLDMWLMLVPNPPHHPEGDFGLSETGRLRQRDAAALTYAGVGVYQPRCFEQLDRHLAARLAPLLNASIAADRAVGTAFQGTWHDIGTVQRLAHLDAYLLQGANVKRSML